MSALGGAAMLVGAAWWGAFAFLLTAKLTGAVDWSWWWVLSPIWGAAAAVVLLCAGAFITFARGVRGLRL